MNFKNINSSTTNLECLKYFKYTNIFFIAFKTINWSTVVGFYLTPPFYAVIKCLIILNVLCIQKRLCMIQVLDRQCTLKSYRRYATVTEKKLIGFFNISEKTREWHVFNASFCHYWELKNVSMWKSDAEVVIDIENGQNPLKSQTISNTV